MTTLSNREVLITGGTGSFGACVVKRLLSTDVREVRVFSRDEKKQNDLRVRLNDPRVKFFIGDVRDSSSLSFPLKGVDFVFHAAALKQVPSCEFFVSEAVKTNVLGTENVLNGCYQADVKKVVCLSTDKAVYPINAMGMTKALMEKTCFSFSRLVSPEEMSICVTRYGNVIGSRGSVIPLFMDQISAGQALTVTDETMTRFIMTLDDAIDLVLYAFEHGNNGDLLVQKALSATVDDIAAAVSIAMERIDHPRQIIGARHGEKLFETLVGGEELVKSIDEGRFIRIPIDQRGLDYARYYEEGEIFSEHVSVTEFNSHNSERISLTALVELIKSEPWFLQIDPHN